MFARINGTGGAPVIQVVAPEEIIVPAGDGVRGGATPRLNDDEMFEGGVGARIGNVVAPLGTPIFVAVAGPLGAKVFDVGDRVTVIEVCVNVLDGRAVICVRPDASTVCLEIRERMCVCEKVKIEKKITFHLWHQMRLNYLSASRLSRHYDSHLTRLVYCSRSKHLEILRHKRTISINLNVCGAACTVAPLPSLGFTKAMLPIFGAKSIGKMFALFI